MAIKKQEYYEGAALHLLIRTGGVTNIQYEAPFFLLNKRVLVYLKYCTKNRSPWGFTFTKDEQVLLTKRGSKEEIIIGLICGADGIAALPSSDFGIIAAPCQSAVHISCYRKHGEHYEVNGPDGKLGGKIAPSNWQKILSYRG